jgi:tetratricopeptide (TPR) repeat protein
VTSREPGKGDVVGDRFEIIDGGTTGGMGTVFRARDRQTGHQVAIKLVTTETQRLAREVNALAELDHPAVVRYIDHRHADGGSYLAMEWLDGEDLGARLKRGPMALSDAAAILERVAGGLAAAHARGIIHRDIKPRNIVLVDRDPARAVIVDFGIARQDNDQTFTRGIIGTPRYMAPEQVTGDRIGPRADVYSLGCVVFECIAGQAPFVAADWMGVMAAKVMAEPPRLGDFVDAAPPGLEALLRRMLARDPGERPVDGGALVAALPAVWTELGESPSAAGAGGDGAVAVTRKEQRISTMILARGRTDKTETPKQEGHSTMQIVGPSELAPVIGGLAARSAHLADGTLVVAVDEPGEPVDRVVLAARAAAALVERYPSLHVGLATGKLSTDAGGCTVIDRATSLLQYAPGAVWLDDVSADLLARTHEIVHDGGVPCLGVEHGDVGAVLLGRVAPFVGRDREIRVLEAIAGQVIEEGASASAIVVGEAGLGKSRLVHELVRRIAVEHDLWTVRADPFAAGAPYTLLGQLVRRVAGVRDDLTLTDRQYRLSTTVSAAAGEGERAARIVLALGAMLGEPWADHDPAVAVARSAGAALADLVRRGWEDWIAALVARRPLVLVVDDLHLADASSLAVIDGLLKRRDLPLLVLGTARPELSTHHPNLWQSRGVQVTTLAPLSPRAAAAFITEVLPSATPERREALIAHAGGSPFLLEELLRAAATSTSREQPVAAIAIVQARLDRLAPELRRVLRAASVFGRDFTQAGVAAVLSPVAESELASALRALERAEVVDLQAGERATVDSGPAASFRHELIRDAAYASLPERDRALAHRRAGTWLGERDAVAPSVVAAHFAAAGAAGEAAQWWARATERAEAAWDMPAVLRFGELAAPGLRGVPLGALEEMRASAFRWAGRLEDAERSAATAVRELPSGEPRWFAAYALQVQMRAMLGAIDGVDALVLALCAAARQVAGHAAALAIGRTLVAFMLRDSDFTQGWRRELERTLDEVLAKLPERSDELEMVLADLEGERALESCDFATALRLGLVVHAIEERRGNVVPALHQHSINGYFMFELGLLDDAERTLAAVLAAARERDVPRLAAHAHHNLGVTVAARGELEAALAHERAAIAFYEKQQDVRMLAMSRLYLGYIQLTRRAFDEAEVEARRALDSITGTKYGPSAWCVLARALLGQDRIVEAEAAIDRTAGETRMAEGWAWIALTRVDILVRRGLHAEAGRACITACEEIQRRAEAITETSWRRAFLTNVEPHRRLLALRARL